MLEAAEYNCIHTPGPPAQWGLSSMLLRHNDIHLSNECTQM